MKKIGLILLALICLQPNYAQTEKNIDWKADLDFLAKELPERHYDFFTVRSREDFSAGIEAIKSESENLTGFQKALKIQQLIARFGDSHTRLNFIPLLDMSQILPLRVTVVSDGLYVVATTPANRELLGQRITAINTFPVSTVIDSLSTLITADNRAMVKLVIPDLLACRQILDYFGFTAPQPQVTLANGKTHLFDLTPPSGGAIETFTPDSLSFADKNQDMLFTAHYFPEDKIYYMLYNSCRSRELEEAVGNGERAAKMPSFQEFEQHAFHTLETEQVDKIIFDLRNNQGGNSSQGTKFIEKLAAYLHAHPHIAVYVVTGRKTFSSAILNAMDFKRLTDAVFVGEQTAGKPNHFGEVQSFELPSSKLQVTYSTKYFKRSDEVVSTLTPDVLIETSFENFTKGIDPVYEWIRKQ